MTSSLVGSEMCIRDRQCMKAQDLVKKENIHQLHPFPKPRVRNPASGPVSYTHLTLPTICSV
eukprot:2853580-Prorocentrum_lima.AAC.1